MKDKMLIICGAAAGVVICALLLWLKLEAVKAVLGR